MNVIDTITNAAATIDTTASWTYVTTETNYDYLHNSNSVGYYCPVKYQYCSAANKYGGCTLNKCKYESQVIKDKSKEKTETVKKENNGMKIVKVKFKNGNDKYYYYQTKINNLLKGGTYEIIVDNKTEYDNYVIILDTDCKQISFSGKLREITEAHLIAAPKRPDGNIENIWINEEKGTTVIKWKDGTITKVRCQNDEEFDAEKGIAMCFMKKAFNNRACFNVVFKKYIEESDE